MTVTHAMPSTPKIQALPRGAVVRSAASGGLAVAAALFLAVLIVESVIVIAGAPNAADLGSLYLITT
jgi:hypothetical protein